MKQNLFKLTMLLMLLLVFNCEKNEFPENTINEVLEMSILNFKQISKNSKLNQQLEKFTNNSSNKEVYNSEHDFIIETENVKYMQSPDGVFHSYTFPIAMDSTETTLKNLVLYSYNNSDYQATLLKYQLTQNQLESLKQNDYTFNGFVGEADNIDIDFSNLFSKTSNPCSATVTVYHTTPDTGETFEFGEGSVCQHIDEDSGQSTCEIHTVTIINCGDTYITDDNSSGNNNSNTTGDPNFDWLDSYGNSGNGSNNNDTNNTNATPVGSSPTVPLFTKPFSLFVNSLTQEQQDFLNNTIAGLTIKLKLQILFNDISDNQNHEIIIQDIITYFVENPLLTFEEVMEQYFIDNLDIYQELIELESPDIPIVNLEDYLDCFNINQNAKVTISVDQPNSDNPNVDFSPFDDGVGHTFITIEQGNNLVSFGFYPAEGIGYLEPTTGVMGNNQNTAYDVSLYAYVTGETLNTLINHSITYASSDYDLTDSNCTSFGLSSANIIGFDIPLSECVGNYVIGSGVTPGQFGEYIKNMELPTSSLGVGKTVGSGFSPTNNDCN